MEGTGEGEPEESRGNAGVPVSPEISWSWYPGIFREPRDAPQGLIMQFDWNTFLLKMFSLKHCGE